MKNDKFLKSINSKAVVMIIGLIGWVMIMHLVYYIVTILGPWGLTFTTLVGLGIVGSISERKEMDKVRKSTQVIEVEVIK